MKVVLEVKYINKVKKANLFFMSILISLILASLFAGNIFYALNISNAMSIVLVEIIFLLIPTFIYFIINKSSVKEDLKLNFMDTPSLGIVVAIGFVSYPIMMFVGAVSQIFFRNFVNDVFNTLATLPYIECLAIVALTPAICEEIVMRGVVFSNYEDVNIKKAVLMNGFMFGVFHLNPQQFFYAFVLGALFAYLVYITNSIFSSMICHFILNGISVTLSFIVMKIYPDEVLSKSNDLAYVPLDQKLALVASTFVLALIFGIVLIKLLKKLKNINKTKNIDTRYDLTSKPKDNESVMNWPIIVSILIYIAFLIIYELNSNVSLFNF